jgi:phosphate-selective porin OprO/OprP
VIPRQNFSMRERHLGAMEWGIRYSYLDLDDGPIKGGRMHVLTSGSSWYFNEFLRWQVEYSYAPVSGGHADGHLHTVQTRLQLSF